MKELLAGFAVDVFRPVVTLLIPGFWAVAPWLISAFFHFQDDWKFACAHREGCGLVFVVVATAAGMILEDLGVRLEKLYFDSYTNGNYENWFRYLTLALETEPIGLRYIRTVVLRMKFELGMAFAGLIAVPGIACIPLSLYGKLIAVSLALAITVYFFYESKSSVILLERTRIELLHRLTSKAPEIAEVKP